MVTRAVNRLSRVPYAVWVWSVAALLLAAVFTPIIWDWLRAQDETLRFPNNVLRVGLDPSRPPFAFFTADGDYAGLEIDLAHAIGEELGVEIQFIPLGFDGLYDALRTNQTDVVLAGLQPVFPARNGEAYTRHYFDAGLVLLAQPERNIESFHDLADGALAYEFGSPADALAHRWLRRVRPFALRPYELPEYAVRAIDVGDADAALVDAITARTYLRDHPDLDASLEQITHTYYAGAVREGRTDLLDALNATLNTLDDSGTLGRIIDDWL
jgi:polar amino acid transport system substrate-binding protein